MTTVLPGLRPTGDRSQQSVGVPELLDVIWHETRANRAAIHRALPDTRCDLRISASDRNRKLIGTVLIDGDCVCRDFLVDMLVECHRYLADRAGELGNPLGAARVHVRKKAVHDWIRRRRTDVGAQARVDRIRKSAMALGLPDEFHRALLEYLADEAGVMAPLDSQEALLRRLATRCAAEFGGAAEHYRARVAAGVALVERHCRSGTRVNAGTAAEPEKVTWWERYIERPMGRRPRRTDKPIATPECGDAANLPAHDPGQVADDSTEFDARVVAVLVAALRRQPVAPDAALRAGLADLVAQGLIPQWCAVELCADCNRFAVAAKELSALA
ncbi:hypothetical protein [Saccharopolyspora sp. ASAGF58]|uniref:hypothetical protein n=1 Tax=Saccharopolyspora sp. ASAGF58 TaxID=2719023 RepID=UPI00143FCD56|nr:hypothetical protein [Saccharopolyspora sp. ASAGF58]QIZ33686.1 hypothetical protein FDZ84_01745 [Saccharopolyspora sp. ASAGF58]